MKMKNNKKGFTLIELIIVIAVLAILAVVAIPVVGNVITSANKSVDDSNKALYEMAIATYTATATDATPAGSGGVYPTTAAVASTAVTTFTNTTTIAVPKSGGHFYYNTVTHKVSYSGAAGTNDVLLSA